MSTYSSYFSGAEGRTMPPFLSSNDSWQISHHPYQQTRTREQWSEEGGTGRSQRGNPAACSETPLTVASCWDLCRCTKLFPLYFFKEKFPKEPLRSCPGADQTHLSHPTDPSKPLPFPAHPVKGHDGIRPCQVFQACFL